MPGDFSVFVTRPGTDEQWSADCAGDVVAGRSTDCDLVLDHPLVSRRHAEIAAAGAEEIVIRDLGSRNGTTVGERTLHGADVRVQGRANLRIGPFTLAVSRMGAQHEYTLPLADADPATATAFRTILFTDVEASTRLVDRMGDLPARRILQEHEALVRVALSQHGGREHKTMGDGFMASFPTAAAAVDAALAMQRTITRYFLDADAPVRIRIGINAGEPISEPDQDLHGAAVIQAARVMAEAGGGEILVTDVVRLLLRGKGVQFEDRGESTFKGFDDPVRVFRIDWAADA